jgi:hypothetical protein
MAFSVNAITRFFTTEIQSTENIRAVCSGNHAFFRTSVPRGNMLCIDVFLS